MVNKKTLVDMLEEPLDKVEAASLDRVAPESAWTIPEVERWFRLLGIQCPGGKKGALLELAEGCI